MLNRETKETKEGNQKTSSEKHQRKEEKVSQGKRVNIKLCINLNKKK